ncbi:uL30 family ribosomal protein [Candidatus Pacearchaeota archaeon]|nr:uL30 family ribosomal protein [Candidatus Pacearchaeota archaeon]
MICVIRIHGQIGLNKDVAETLYRLRVRQKYACVVLNPTKEQLGMILKVRDFVAFGEITKENFEKLIKARGQLIDKSKKIGDSKKLAEELEKGKDYKELNLKPFFRLHPPRKGIKSKLHFPKGVLGDNKKKINDLIERML